MRNLADKFPQPGRKKDHAPVPEREVAPESKEQTPKVNFIEDPDGAILAIAQIEGQDWYRWATTPNPDGNPGHPEKVMAEILRRQKLGRSKRYPPIYGGDFGHRYRVFGDGTVGLLMSSVRTDEPSALIPLREDLAQWGLREA